MASGSMCRTKRVGHMAAPTSVAEDRGGRMQAQEWAEICPVELRNGEVWVKTTFGHADPAGHWRERLGSGLAHDVRYPAVATQRRGSLGVLSRCRGASVVDPFAAGILTSERRPRTMLSSMRRVASGVSEPR
jgi:hypothetical protein